MKNLLIYFIVLLFSCNPKRTTEQQAAGEQPEEPSYQGSCGYLTEREMEDALGVRLAEPPETFSDALMGTGCSFAGEDTGRNANFGYVAFGGSQGFENARTGEKISEVGDEAYFVHGADALQLWAREENTYVVVALGDEPRPDACKKLTRLLLQRLKERPFVQ